MSAVKAKGGRRIPRAETDTSQVFREWHTRSVEHFTDWASELELDSGEPWIPEPFQLAFVDDFFSGFKTSWLIVPEGNGKTTLIAGLALHHIQFTPNAYVAVAASSRDQAEWIYRQAEGFVVRNGLEDLTRSTAARNREPHRFRCLEGYRRIRHDATNSRIQIFAADDRGGDGAIASLFILDELHRHRDLDLYRTWSGKIGKRSGQLIAISTAGLAGSQFEDERARLRRTADEIERKAAFVRVVDKKSGTVMHEWALPEDGDPEDLLAVKAANPFSGVTLQSLAEKRMLPAMTIQHWTRFTGNRASRAVQAAIMEAEWDSALTEQRIPEGEPLAVGLDVAWKWDTTALVPLWWKDEQFRLLGEAVILEPPRDGTTLDPARVEKAILDLHALNPIHTVVMDTTRAEQLADWIASTTGATVIDRAQGNALMAEDYERFMDALRNGWLWHTGDPGLRRHVLNAITRVLPDGKARFDREKQSRTASAQNSRVIDALTAAAMVHCEMVGGAGGGLVY